MAAPLIFTKLLEVMLRDSLKMPGAEGNRHFQDVQRYFHGHNTTKAFPDYRLSSATLFWYKPGTCCCFCGFERMARNKVQFQKGLSEAQFATLYGTEDLCREVLTRWRWPSGFVCPVCGGKHHSIVKTRALYQCTACRRQTSLI